MRTLKKIECIEYDDKNYPEQLRNIKDPPKQLYVCGDSTLFNRRLIAVVGSRKFTVYGKTVSNMIGKRLAECGAVVVSGLAYGIDGFAHEGVVDAKGKGIGVLGSGIRMMTPRSNHELMLDMLDAGGLVVSEYPPDYPASKATYPRRNRIISGLSEAVVVVEANFDSGALITAHFANEQGKPVYAVPGNINSQFSLGSNLLIRDGANPLIVIDDLLSNLGIDTRPAISTSIALAGDEKEILDIVKNYNGVSADNIARSLNKRVGKVNSILTVLEIKGIVENIGGKIYLAN